MVNSVLPPRIFPRREDLEKIRPGYEAATRAEIGKIIEKIPADELAIQWDCSTEVQDAYGSIPGFPFEGAIERNLAEVRNLSPAIPPDVALGYHFCFGTLGGWPRFQPNDLSQAVKLANAFVAASGRKVDWIHIPVLDRDEESFFAPLQYLAPQGARVFLGAIHNMARFQDPQRDSRLLAHPALDGPRTVQTLRSLRVIARETACQLNRDRSRWDALSVEPLAQRSPG